MKLLDFYEKESIEKEFKRLTLHKSGLSLSKSESLEIINDGIYIGNDIIYKSLKEYLQVYVPKYMAIFSNQEIGELYIGIDDFGFISGIPFQGELDIDELIMNIDYHKISGDIDYFKNFKYEVIKLEKADIYNSRIEKYIKKYYQDLEIYQLKKNKYINQYLKWHKKITFYTGKLEEMINQKDFRNDLINYSYKLYSLSLLKEKNLYTFKKVIKYLKETDYINIPNTEYIIQNKENPGNYLYYLTRYKDHLVDLWAKKKPHKPIHKICHPNEFLIGLDTMIEKWKNICNYYLIKITFIGKHPDKELYYHRNYRDLKLFRKMRNNTPITIEF